MREPLFTDYQEITNELTSLLKNEAQLKLYQQAKTVQPVLIQGFVFKHEPPLVVILKKNDFQAEESSGCLLYRQGCQNPRGFDVTIVKQSQHRLGVSLPAEIFQIQRRKNDRHGTPPPSKLVFTLKAGQRLHNAQVIDISCEGARLRGTFPPQLKRNMAIGPLSFSLHLQLSKAEITRFTAAEATIAWTSENDLGINEIGLRLQMAPTEQEKLNLYIEMRDVEEAVTQPARSR